MSEEYFEKELARIEKIEDEKERDKELDRLVDKRIALEEAKKDKIKKEILDLGIRANVLNKSDLDIKKKWESHFTNNLDEKIKSEIYYNQFYWHAFSYEQIDCVNGDEARKQFNEIEKSSFYAFYQENNKLILYENASLAKDVHFDLENDIYLVDADFKWTYIVTHEKEMCGPYFKSIS